VVQHPGLVSPTLRPLPLLCLPQTLHDLHAILSSGCLATTNNPMMNDEQTRCSLSSFNCQPAKIA
jgi:hypothetical protein